jgi:hypothetical protein
VTTSVTDGGALSWLQPHPNGNMLETYSIERATGNGAFGAIGTVAYSSTCRCRFTPTRVVRRRQRIAIVCACSVAWA